MIYLGIDPGLSGGLAIIAPDEVLLFATPTSKGSPREYFEAQMDGMICEALARGKCVAAIEVQSTRPREGLRAALKTGLGWGLWRGMLAAHSIPYDLWTPAAWHKLIGLAPGSDKSASVALAGRLFPDQGEELYGPRGAERDGVAEALLIAEARRRVG